VSALTLVSPLLENVELAPGQLAELRAIDAMYHSRIAADPAASSVSNSALDALVLSRVREMLHEDQRARFDLNCATHYSHEVRSSAPAGRRR
jgi:hypothetical protein